MKFLPIIYLAYMFIALYFFFFFLVLFIKNRKTLFDYPKAEKKYGVSVVTPAYNEEGSIEGTIRAVFDSDYPIKEMIVVDDGSKDRTKAIVGELMKRYKNLKLISKNNSGKADSLNRGLKIAKGELIAVIDSDSYPEKDAIGKMIGFFNDSNVGAVTCSILVKHKNMFIEKLQGMEYAIIAWTRKLLGYIEGIWATPGPLSIYRASALKKAGGFDTTNLTEDIEVTWNIISKGYKVEMCLPARVYSIAPKKTRYWIKQRIRWDIGGIQCMNKYKSLFLKRGMLGFFILPFFTLSMFLGLVGFSIFSFLAIRKAVQTFLFTKYSLDAGTQILSFKELYVTPTILNFFGVILFILGVFFTIFGLGIMKEGRFKGIRNIFNLLYYMIVYLTLYPSILVIAIGKIIKYKIQGKRIGWGTK
ncbi:glycosyltransferase family 2 protein [Candidatus Pacearchaeota archaeon]|nr:glycosyltransferase family 2 protein [Candidatus Pacearchaeota archaeon]